MSDPQFRRRFGSTMISETDDVSPRKSNAAQVQNRRLSIIDVCSADDSLIHPLSTLSENQEHSDILYTPNSKKFEDAATKLEQWEREPQSNEPSEIGKPKKNSKCNLRKSLAWDSAFFTSAGVLDAEELSSIIEGVEKDEKHEIEDDVYKSCESISTLESDSLTLDESVEGDLFEDVRASIQKSSKKSNLASGYSRVPPSGIAGFQVDDCSKKIGMSSHNKMKGLPPSRNPSAGMQGLGKVAKKNPNFPQLPQPVATRRESSISRQSKVPGKSTSSSTISSKRVSIGDIRVKSEKDKAKRTIGDRVTSVSKASGTGGSRGNLPKPAVSSRSPSGPLISTKTKSATSTSSSNNLYVDKSPFNFLKRKVDVGTSKPPPSRPAVRTPSRIASSNKIESGNSVLSGLMSVTKLSSSISPASSISDWSSESSSSISLAKHMCNSSRTSVDSCSSRKVLSDTVADQGTYFQIPQSDSSLEGQETQNTGFISETARNAPGATVHPPTLMKPSGLRLPSPKIGFFDGVKSSGRTPRGGMQPHSVVPRGLPKHGAGSPSECQNKAKLGKLQPARSVMPIEKTKPNDQQINDLHRLNGGVNNQEIAQYDNQVDCLSQQVGLMDINVETREKFNGDSLFFSQSDVSIQDKSNDMVLSSHKELVDCPKNEELLKSPCTPCLSISPTGFDVAASTRTPLAVKDSVCNMNGSICTESTVSEVKPPNLPVPESIMKEN